MRNEIQYAGRVFSDAPGAAHRLLSGDCLLGHSDLSDQLAADCLEFDVRSGDLSLGAYTEGEPLRYCYQGELIGTFYVQSVERTGRESYHFTALSAVGRLMRKLHYGGMYTGQSAGEVIPEICSGTGVPVEIKTIFQPYRLYGWLPVASARDNLSQVLFAIGAALRTDANGVLRVTSLYTGPGWVRGPERCFVGGSVAYAAPVARVIVTEHKWEPGGETVALFDGAAKEGDIIRFGQPVHSLQAKGLTILESGCNYAKVSTGTGTITGLKYEHNLRDIVRAVPGNAQGRDVTVKEAYLLSPMNSLGVAERLSDYYAHTERITQETLWAGEHAGDIVRTAHPYGGTADVLLSSADLTLSGILRAQEKGVVGYKPPLPESQTYYDQVVVLTGSGTWTVPEEIEGNGRAVLIGGGQGGPGGRSGGQGQKGGTSTGTGVYRVHAGSAGEGGAGAERGGEGGNIYELDLDLSPGQVFVYASGVGGLGGYNGAEGSRGSDTTFGPYSSASGAPRSAGYTEAISGTVYAQANQTPGVKGGSGTGSLDPSKWNAEFRIGETVYAPDGSAWIPGDSGAGYGYTTGGWGGGAAVGSNGGRGGNGTGSRTGSGGTGASPVTPSPATVLGKGGAGGHGGGGGGGNGESRAPHSGITAGNPGSGGSGGRGGQGGPGGVIIYYTAKRKTVSGRFLTRNHAPFFSRKKRIFSV